MGCSRDAPRRLATRNFSIGANSTRREVRVADISDEDGLLNGDVSAQFGGDRMKANGICRRRQSITLGQVRFLYTDFAT